MKHMRSKKALVILLVIILIGTFLRLNNLGGKSFTQEEAQFWSWSQFDYLRGTINGNSYTPASIFVFMITYFRSWARSEAVLRSLAVAFGVISIPAIYLLVKKLHKGETAALVAAGIIALGPNQVEHAQLLREFTLVVLITIMIYYFYYDFVSSQKTTSLIGLLIFSVLGILTQIGTTFVLASLGLVTLILLLRQKQLRQPRILLLLAMYSLFVLLTGYLLWHYSLRYVYSTGQGFAGTGYLSTGYWNRTFDSFINLFWYKSWDQLDFAIYGEFTLLTFLLFVWGIAHVQKQERKSDVVQILLFPFAVTFLAAMMSLYPYMGWRHNIYLSVSIIAFVSIGLSELRKARKEVFFAILLVSAIMMFEISWSRTNAVGTEELKPVTQTLCETVDGDDLILVQEETKWTFDFYWRNCPRVDVPIGEPQDTAHLYQNPSVQFVDNFEESHFSGQQKIWLVFTHLSERERNQIIKSIQNVTPREITLFDEAEGAWLYQVPSN